MYKSFNLPTMCGLNLIMFIFYTGALWVCVVLNPSCLPSDKDYWQQLLDQWSVSPVCPLEDADTRPTNDVLMSNIGISSTSSKIYMGLW